MDAKVMMDVSSGVTVSSVVRSFVNTHPVTGKNVVVLRYEGPRKDNPDFRLLPVVGTAGLCLRIPGQRE